MACPCRYAVAFHARALFTGHARGLPPPLPPGVPARPLPPVCRPCHRGAPAAIPVLPHPAHQSPRHCPARWPPPRSSRPPAFAWCMGVASACAFLFLALLCHIAALCRVPPWARPTRAPTRHTLGLFLGPGFCATRAAP
eukprot:gene11086-biopygen7967